MNVKAIWMYKNRRYLLAEKPEGVAIKTAERILSYQEFLKKIAELDEEIIESLANADIIFDPFNIIKAVSEGIRKGIFFGTKEHIINKLLKAVMKLKSASRGKVEIMEKIYMAATDALQAIILKITGEIVVPKHLYEYVDKNLPKQFYKDGLAYKEIYDAIKELEHGNKVPEGKRIDKFLEYTKNIIKDAEKL